MIGNYAATDELVQLEANRLCPSCDMEDGTHQDWCTPEMVQDIHDEIDRDIVLKKNGLLPCNESITLGALTFVCDLPKGHAGDHNGIRLKSKGN